MSGLPCAALDCACRYQWPSYGLGAAMNNPFIPQPAEAPMSHSIADRDLRERCLKLALERPSADPLETAERYFAFVTGQAPKTARQAIDEALEAAGVT